MKGLLLGAIAAAIDSVPMLIEGLGWNECSSAALHWLGMGILIAHLKTPLPGWATGAGAALLTGLSIALLVFKDDPMAVFPIILSSLFLGAGIGFFSHRPKKQQEQL